MNNISEKQIDFVDIKKSKIGVIYVYYERKNEQKNQTNLSFFLKYALDNRIWYNLDITYLFIINGNNCEVTIPTIPNVHILKQDNCSDWEGWYDGIRYFERNNNKNIWEMFDYLCLINASAIGPILESDVNNHWLMPFYNKMKKDNAVICSPCISFLDKNDISGIGPRIVPIFSFIKIDKEIINLLINEKVCLVDETSIENKRENYYNTILGKKRDKIDAIGTGEYGLSRILLKYNYRLTSLLYDDIDINDENVWSINNYVQPDRYNTFNGKNIPLSTIFIKNVWRCFEFYASKPVLYKECIDFVYKKLNITNIYNDINNDYCYDMININYVNHLKYFRYRIPDLYNEYSYAEEPIIFYNKKHENNNIVIYAHYDKDNIIKDYVIQGIKSLLLLNYEVLFFTACEKITNVDMNKLPIYVTYVKNFGVGTDWKIWLLALKFIKQNELKYKWIMMMNDSILFPINGIEKFKNTVINMRKKCDFWGHWDSEEIRWHIVGTPIEFKYTLLEDVITFISNSIETCKKDYHYIENVETRFAEYLINKGYKSKVVIQYKSLINKYVCCPTHNPYNIIKWINNTNSFAIKWKYTISYLNSKVVPPEFNYLTRFLYYGPYGHISNGEKVGLFPNSLEYSNKYLNIE